MKQHKTRRKMKPRKRAKQSCTDPRPVAWDLFSGSGSVSRALEKAGFRVFSIEKNPKYAKKTNAICADCTTFNYKNYLNQT